MFIEPKPKKLILKLQRSGMKSWLCAWSTPPADNHSSAELQHAAPMELGIFAAGLL
jgi:hypothetical protein